MYLSIYISIYLSIYLPIYLYIYLSSIYQCIYLYMITFIYLHVFLNSCCTHESISYVQFCIFLSFLSSVYLSTFIDLTCVMVSGWQSQSAWQPGVTCLSGRVPELRPHADGSSHVAPGQQSPPLCLLACNRMKQVWVFTILVPWATICVITAIHEGYHRGCSWHKLSDVPAGWHLMMMYLLCCSLSYKVQFGQIWNEKKSEFWTLSGGY